MMKRIVLYIVAVSVLCTGLFSTAIVSADTTATEKCVGGSVLLFPPWYQGLQCDVTRNDKKELVSENVKMTDINSIWVIVMNIVQWLIIAGGYVALYFIIWSGFKYITATGDPQKVTAAKNTITNAVIGFIIVLASFAIVRTIQAGIGGVIQ